VILHPTFHHIGHHGNNHTRENDHTDYVNKASKKYRHSTDFITTTEIVKGIAINQEI
jgi:hypothetical protein